MALVIKKLVDLSSLGEEYRDVTLVFKSIPALKISEIYKRQAEVDKQKKDQTDLEKYVPFFIGILKEYFIEGESKESKIEKEDLDELSPDPIFHCYQILMGEENDPKAKSESTSTSTTNMDTAPKSKNTNTDDSSA